jgi:hypothetical protein
VVVLALVALVHGELRPAAVDDADAMVPRAPEATPGAVALLGGLAAGDAVAGWTVLGIDGPRDERIRIDLGRDGVRFAIMVMRLGAIPRTPPVQTDRYAIYYGHGQPADTTIPAGAVRAITHQIARRIRTVEADVPVPVGL